MSIGITRDEYEAEQCEWQAEIGALQARLDAIVKYCSGVEPYADLPKELDLTKAYTAGILHGQRHCADSVLKLAGNLVA